MTRNRPSSLLMLLAPVTFFAYLLAARAQSTGQEGVPADSIAIVVGSDPSQIHTFAARELTRYIERMAGQKIQKGTAAAHRIYIGEIPTGLPAQAITKLREDSGPLCRDGFIVRKVGADVIVMGKGDRGELYGCYAFLEHLGIRWFFPGKEHEVVPRRGINWSQPLNIVESPTFAERTLFYWPHNYTKFEDWIDFSAKTRLNRIAIHYTLPARDWYINARGRALPELQKRGMTIEVGGHLLSYFLPRTMIKEKPDWFRMSESGQRTSDFNFNPFNAEVLDYVGSRAVKYLAQTPEASLFHVWADDIWGGGWTHERGKEDYTASDQALLVSNDLLRRLRKEVPDANIAFLAYHDTVYPPRVVKPDPGVIYFYAPRERCYGHALESPDCPLNRKYSQALEQGLPAFGAANAEVFEYYVDQILYENLTNPPLPEVLAADAKYYHRLGIPNVGALMTNTAEFLSPMVNMFLYPQALWNPQRDLNVSIREYAQLYFGDAEVGKYFDELKVGLMEVLKVCEYEIPGSAWDFPRVEQEKDEALQRHVERIEQALRGSLLKADSILRAATSRAKGKYRTRLEGESKSMQFTILQAKLYYHLLKGERLYRTWKKQRNAEAGVGVLRESVLARYTWENQKKLVARAGIKGRPLIPDPAVLEERAQELVKAGYSIDRLDQHLAKAVLGSTVGGPSGSMAVLWTDLPTSASAISVEGNRLNWQDEFGQALDGKRINLYDAAVVIEAPGVPPEQLFAELAKLQDGK